MTFQENLKFGEEGEKLIAELLINDGYYVMPLYQFEATHAPHILGSNHEFISPDLIIFKDSITKYIEVKRKNKWNNYQNKYTTGIDYRKYIQYKTLSQLTQIPFELYFIHEVIEPIGIFQIDIQTPGEYWDGKVYGEQRYSAMYFWNHTQLKKIK